MSAIFSLGINLLKMSEIYKKENVHSVLREYSEIQIIDTLVTIPLPNNEFDILGLIYQSFLREGKKNIIGSYYTPQKIAHNMTKDFNFSDGKLFLDPCCGSGAFLLSVKVNNPNQIFGIDNDRIAVLISKINLLIKYNNFDFNPQVYCFDFLMVNSIYTKYPVFWKKFDYIATNPPWGSMVNNYNLGYSISSKESFSYFFIAAYKKINSNGIIRFLFPESILNVNIHKDIRKFILNVAGIISITKYDDMFSGITTKFIDIKCGYGYDKEKFTLYSSGQKRIIDIKTVYQTKDIIFNFLSYDDMSIIRTVKNMGCYSLINSIFALGIVTGDNKGKLSSICIGKMEKIYTGKEIQPYILNHAKNYILYDRSSFQQVAKEEIYRAPEKLAYKFISRKLIFAYDNNANLFLNSANILIPKIPSMSIKSVMAFLNSSLFQFMYIKLFGGVKILKKNLIELPFPKISKIDDTNLTTLVDDVLRGDNSKKETIDRYIFSIYGLTENQIIYVWRTINGKI